MASAPRCHRWAVVEGRGSRNALVDCWQKKVSRLAFRVSDAITHLPWLISKNIMHYCTATKLDLRAKERKEKRNRKRSQLLHVKDFLEELWTRRWGKRWGE